MSAKIKCTGEPIGNVQVVADFLLSHAELAFREPCDTSHLMAEKSTTGSLPRVRSSIAKPLA